MRGNDYDASDLHELDRFRRCSTPPPDVIMKEMMGGEGESNTISSLQQYLYRPARVQSPSSLIAVDEIFEPESAVPILLPSLMDDSGDEPMDVDEAPTPSSFALWEAPDQTAGAMPPPPVPIVFASPEAANSPLRKDRIAARSPPGPKRRLTFPASPPRARRPLGPRSLSVDSPANVTFRVLTKERVQGVRKSKTERKVQHLRSPPITSPVPHTHTQGASREGTSPFKRRLNLNLRFEGRRSQTLVHLVGQHLARTEQYAQLAALMLVSRPTVPLLSPLLLRTVHLSHTNLAPFLRKFVPQSSEKKLARKKKDPPFRVNGVQCIVIHSLPEFAPWPAGLLNGTLTGARRVVVHCPLRGPLMQRTVSLLANPEQVCLDARAVDGPSALSFALCVLPRWTELQELTIHNAGALQGSKVLNDLYARNFSTPGEYRSQLRSMFEQKSVMFTLDFGDDRIESRELSKEVQMSVPHEGASVVRLNAGAGTEPNDVWQRFFNSLDLVDALSVNVIVPHRGRNTLPGPGGVDAVKHALRAKRRGWSFARIEDTKVRCACGQNVAKAADAR